MVVFSQVLSVTCGLPLTPSWGPSYRRCPWTAPTTCAPQPAATPSTLAGQVSRTTFILIDISVIAEELAKILKAKYKKIR